MGLHLISHNPDRTLVVFASDTELRSFLGKLDEYASEAPGSHVYAFLSAIDGVLPLGPEDRRGRRLHASPVGEDEIGVVDVEIMHPGDRALCNQWLSELRQLVERGRGRLTDSFIGQYMCLARCHLSAQSLEEVLGVDFVLEVDRVPRPTFRMSMLLETTLDQLPPVGQPAEDAAGILVVDSGIMTGHPLLQPTIEEATAFVGDRAGAPDSTDADGVYPGHGTAVAGIAAYGDVAECVRTGAFEPSVKLFSARVLDEQCRYDPDILCEHQIDRAVKHFVDRYPQCKVVNLSLGDSDRPLPEGRRQFRLAARLDELAYELSDKNIVFVVSAGNVSDPGVGGEEGVLGYPGSLFNESSRVVDPGTAAIALTVGSVATGNQPQRHPGDPARRCVAGVEGYPSPFTRTGYGVNGMVKPDVVYFGGDTIMDRLGLQSDPGVGIPTTSSEFAPPEGRLFRSVTGTSFSAPAVSNMCARLFERFPGASSNLVRALIAASARLPSERPPELEVAGNAAETLRVYGYGIPDYERAAFSDTADLLLVAQGEIRVGWFHLHQIPTLPDEFLRTRGRKRISVALAFDPPTRHTRASYLGIGMQFHLFRNLGQQDVVNLFRDWEQAPADEGETKVKGLLSKLPGSQKVGLSPGQQLRSKGTLQKGVLDISRSTWSYDQGNMYLGVICLRKWAPEEIDRQRYAVAVSLEHEDSTVPLYEHIRQQVQVAHRIRVRA